jgi:D-lactate dehydrogenase
MINKSSLLQMKDNIMLINTSRGALINTTDIIEAKKSGKVGYLGIDVYEQEEKFFLKICLKILFKTMIYND